MTCITDGILRAKLDGELSQAELPGVNSHLASCADCRRRAETMAQQAERVGGSLSALAPLPDEAAADARIALTRFKARAEAAEAEAPSLLGRLFAPRQRPAWGTLVLASLIVTFLSLAPARSWAQRILAMLRVQKIAVVSVDLESLGGLNPDGRLGKTIGQLISDNVIVTMKPGEPEVVAGGEQASELAGFKVRLLSSRADPPQLKVQGETAFHMTVNRDRLQEILNEVGHSDLQLPASLDGATIAVHIPKAVLAQYGNCWSSPGRGETHSLSQGNASGCVDLAQVPSPTLSVPSDLNMEQLAEMAMQLGGMSAEDARAFCQTVDWTSTFVLGVPRGTSYQTVEVDGVQGTLIDLPRHRERRTGPPRYALLWVRNGIIYALSGEGSSADAVPLAESLN